MHRNVFAMLSGYAAAYTSYAFGGSCRCCMCLVCLDSSDNVVHVGS